MGLLSFILNIFFGLFFLLPNSFADHSKISQEKRSDVPSLQWLTLDQALVKNKTIPKKILVDVYTDWCGWCKRMDKQVYQNKEVVEKLNKDFYVVKLNAEQRQSITINGTVFRYEEQYKTHALAVSLLQGEMSYPSTVFLNEKEQVMQRLLGYYSAKDFLKVLSFITEN